MEIGPISNRDNAEQTKRAVPREQAEPQSADAKNDQVEISQEARAKLAELADRQLAEKGRHLSIPDDSGGDDSLIKRIREKIESGYYNQPQVRSDIASRLIDDLDKQTE